ncbi:MULTISPECIES: endo-1,4-beta-xylanase [Olivibacter]|jgi:endo-1,4-beta-xylanase|uniref:Beta-xylanase n=1 Tax=Olivibacter jilunii TaxID=985016 RepID=A0ABW6B2Q6_9SPHI|nr:endo-1,4-beta-xylanase [Olivibacter sp. UJ_SKK_5.1]MDX3916636.1 endo-1,4-beta-xylanase [Pseudosphingobacterium sp.]
MLYRKSKTNAINSSPTNAICLFLFVLLCVQSLMAQNNTKGLKDYYQEFFPIGVAVNGRSLAGQEAHLLLQEFNSITPENAMKMEVIHPRKLEYNWALADSIVAFAQKNRLRVRGHTLLWHEQVPDWFFLDDQGAPVTKDTLLKRLKDHITTVVGRYKGKVYAWDVLNEAIDDNPKQFLRQSKWLEIAGEEILAKAFEYAHEVDPDALLFYNDYNSERPEKRERIYRLVKKLVDDGVPIHGIGLQGHWSIFEPSTSDLEQALERYASLGLQLHFTELDVSVYPWEKERRRKRPGEIDALTPALEEKQIAQYEMIFSVFRKYKSHITSVTFWNLSDRYSWLDHYPVQGRKNYPLLFDRNLERKKAYYKVVDFKN